MRRWLILVLLLLTAQAPIAVEQPLPTATPRRLDIVGVRIGQTPDQVRAAMTLYHDTARITERTVSGLDGRPFTEGMRLFNAVQATPGAGYLMREDVEAAFSGIASGNRVIGIEQRVLYVGSARVDAAPVIASLRDKYGISPDDGEGLGTYTPTGFSVLTWRWLFAADGRPLRRGAADLCPTELGQYRANCPVQLTATVRARDGKLEGLTLSLKDNPFATATLSLDQQMAARDRTLLVPSPQPLR